MGDVVVIEEEKKMKDGIELEDIGEEMVKEKLEFRWEEKEEGNIEEVDKGRDDLIREGNKRNLVMERIWKGKLEGVRINGEERIIWGMWGGSIGKRVEKSRIEKIWKKEDEEFEKNDIKYKNRILLLWIWVIGKGRVKRRRSREGLIIIKKKIFKNLRNREDLGNIGIFMVMERMKNMDMGIWRRIIKLRGICIEEEWKMIEVENGEWNEVNEDVIIEYGKNGEIVGEGENKSIKKLIVGIGEIEKKIIMKELIREGMEDEKKNEEIIM